MSCSNQFRHVCLKDLENYIKRDTYFSDFSEQEILQIQKNLGIITSNSNIDEYNPILITGTYDQIVQHLYSASLKIGYIYVITDFRSIYLDCDSNICGTEAFIPSQECWIFLTPVSSNAFDKRVSLLSPKAITNCQDWIVEYDITKNSCAQSKGTITYLKDTNGNYAYYDFKNIKFKKSIADLNKGPVRYDHDTYLYTFDNNGVDASELNCKNNHLENGAYNNVFLGTTKNVTLDSDCHDNIFFKNTENAHFLYGTYNNYFKDNVSHCYGIVHDKELAEITTLPSTKHFEQLGNKQIVTYFDHETLTQQITQL